MPSLRRGLSQGLLSVSDVFQTLLQNELRKQQQMEVLKRQSAIEQQRSTGDLFQSAVKDPQVAERLQRAGIEELMGVGMEGLTRTDPERANPILQTIGGASELASLLTDREAIEGLRGQGVDVDPVLGREFTPGKGVGSDRTLGASHFVPTQPRPVANVLAALGSRRDMLTDEASIPTTPIESIDPRSGQTTTRYEPTRSLADLPPQITGLGAADTGRLETERALSGELSPEFVGGQVRASNQLEAGTRGEKVRTAGAESFAREAGSQRASLQFAPQRLQQEIQKALQMIPIELSKAQQLQSAKAVQEASVESYKNTSRIQTLYKLWTLAEPKIQESMLTRIGGEAGAATLEALPYSLQDKDVRVYFQTLESMLPYFARMTGEVGNLAEEEQLRQKYAAPTAIDAVNGTADEKIARLMAFSILSPRITALSGNPEFQSYDNRTKFNTIDRMIEEEMANLLGGQLQGLKPTTGVKRFKVQVGGGIQ